MADLLLHPVLPLSIAAAVLPLLPRTAGAVVAVTAPVVALLQVALLQLGTRVGVPFHLGELEVLRVDGLSRPFGVVFAIAATIAAIYGLRTMTSGERSAAMAYAGAAMGVVFAGDLLTFFVFWEIKAIASTLVVLSRRHERASRAGVRYLYLHLIGGKLLLAGVVWHLVETGSLAFTAFDLRPATILILVACLLSAAVPLLHAWLPDAYPVATVAGTVFLSAYTTKAAVYALARGFPGTGLLVGLGVAMALYGVVYAVLENDTRRLLAYHIISQVGYMVAGVGIGTQAALNGATAHAFAHILYKGVLLMGAGAVIHATGRAKMSELGGIANRMRGVLVLYLVGAAAISSVPLFSGFVSKELVVDAAGLADLGWAVVLLQIASVGTFLHTGLKLPYGTWFGPEGAGPRTNEGARIQVGPVPPSMYVALGIGAALNVAIGVYPALLYDLLPYAVDYDPYTVTNVLAKVQMLAFTALGFWLLLPQLSAKAVVSADVDVAYRKLLRPLTVRFTAPAEGAAAGRGGAALPDAASDDQLARPGPVATRVAVARAALDPERAPAGREPPVPATWVLGSVIVATTVVVLVLSVLP